MLKIVAFITATLISSNVCAENKAYVPTVMPPKEEVLRINQSDIVIGCPDAKHVIIEYSSLACPHCATYHKSVFPIVESEIVKKCKAKYVYRSFPTTRSALKGVALAQCIATSDNKVDSNKFFKNIQFLSNAQNSWAFQETYEDSLIKLFTLNGVDKTHLNQCMADKDLMADIVSKSFISMKVLGLIHSPAIFVDGVEVASPTFDAINEAVK